MTKTHALLAAALVLCLVGTSAAVAQQKVADTDIGENAVIWHPLVSDKLVLSVSGPGGDFQHTFAAGERPALEVFDKDGALLADGNYTWQLTSLPTVSQETRAAMQKSRDEGVPFTGTVSRGITQSGYLTVKDGYFVIPAQEATQPAQPVDPNKDQVIADDLIVQSSACIGQDCVNGESFGFDTLRLKENNLRIKFQDTSNSASFPSRDWQLTANDSTNGGANKFSIDDIDGGRTPFTIEASAPSHSLYVDDGGRIGFGTATPVVELHIVDGDSPTIRLEQDGSSGFTAQTWDVAGNETNFFVRDITNGSKLPFKIRPTAPTNSLYINTDGNIGLGTASPSAPLHVQRSNGTAQVLIDDNSATAPASPMLNIDTAATSGVVTMFNLVTAGARPRFTMTHPGAIPGSTTWNFDILNTDGEFSIVLGGSSPTINFDFQRDGDLSIDGNYIRAGVAIPDWVFAADYPLMPLDEVKAFIAKESHLPNVPSTKEVEAEGLDMTKMQLALLQKVEELTLYTLDQHDTIRTQQSTIQQLMERLEALENAQR